MSEKVVGLGEVGDHLPNQPWILVLGGTSREGNRRARRAIRNALEVNTGALWFDGYSERSSEGSVQRVPLNVPVPNGCVVIVDYAAKERGQWLNWMVEGVPGALLSSVIKAEDMVADAGDGTRAGCDAHEAGIRESSGIRSKEGLEKVQPHISGKGGLADR